jgi:thymidylate kinase
MTQARSENRERRFVSFSGMDGAGKSTQIHNLRTRLTEAGLRVSLITFWDDIARLTQLREVSGHKLFKGEKGVGSPDAPINRRDKNVRSWPMTLVRYFLYFVDAVSLRLVVQKALRSDADFIIFDRYAYDELANLTLGDPIARLYVRLIMKIVPRPHISYVLDADPVQARARKPEYPLEFLYLCRASYFALSNLIGGMTIIPPMPVQDVEREVLQQALKQMPLGWAHREVAADLVAQKHGD